MKSIFFMKTIESKFNRAEKLEIEKVNPQEYLDEYMEYVKEKLEKADFEIEIKKVPVGKNTNVVIEFGKDGEHLGEIINNFQTDQVVLAAILSKGGSGILEPLYQAESEFFMSKGIVVGGKFVSGATKAKFLKYYPGAVCKNEKKSQYVYNPN